MSVRLPLLARSLAALVVVAVAVGPVHAQVLLDPDRPAPDLGEAIEVLDVAPGARLAGVVRAPRLRVGAPLDEAPPGEAVVWLRLRLQSASVRDSRWLLTLAFDTADVFVVGPDGQVERQRTGRDVPLARRPVAIDSPPVAQVDLPPGAARTVYVRVRHTVGGYDDVRPIAITESGAFLDARRRFEFGQGLFFGLLIALALYNAFLFASFQDRSYLYYVAYLVATAVFWGVSTGIAFEWAWPAEWAGRLEASFYALTIAAAAYLLFGRAFLRTPALMPGLDRVLRAEVAAWGGVALMAAAGAWTLAMTLAAGLGLAMLATTLLAGLLAVRRGSRPAVTYLIASSALIVSGTAYIAAWFGWIEGQGLAGHALQIGAAAEAVLFAMALSYRIRRLDRERSDALTARREAETTSDALREADALKTNLVGFAAHDLRSPLTGILGFAELIEDESRSGSETGEFAAAIQREAGRMLALIDDLLVTSALGSGRLELVPVSVDLARLAQDAASAFALRAARKDQTFTTDPAVPTWVHADPSRLREVIDNLVSNAVKYTPHGGSVGISVSAVHGEARLAVHDTGPGLTADDRQRLFQPFQRLSAQPTGNESSTGLGLSIARQIVLLHGGRLMVETTPGQGSTFSVALPALDDPDAPPAREPPASDSSRFDDAAVLAR